MLGKYTSKENTHVDKPTDQTMIFIKGQCFYCPCGCNVFTKLEPKKFRCNSCQEVYEGS